MSKMIDDLKKHLSSIPLKELKKEWEAVKKHNDVGPTVDDFMDAWEEDAWKEGDDCDNIGN